MAKPGYQILAFLVNPSGTPVDVQSSEQWDGSGTNSQNISLFRQNPEPGTWQLMVVQDNNVESVLTSARSRTARQHLAQAKAVGLPDSTKQRISAGGRRSSPSSR